jgi:hypothetical protein
MALPKPQGRKAEMTRTKAGRLPEPTGGGDFDPFLKAEHIGKVGTRAKIKIVGAPEETPDSEYSDMQVPVTYKGTRYALGLKVSGGNYGRLFKMFGDNPKKWHGTVDVEVKHFKANDYVAVV